MTDDRELLELAAKAAGIPTDLAHGGFIDAAGVWYVTRYWNPLTDPGDALRLAVALDIDIHPGGAKATVSWWVRPAFVEQDTVTEMHGTDKLAATMREIVRAAAEVGRRMK